jgi:hypothetical protein
MIASDPRPRQTVEAIRAWTYGENRMSESRVRSTPCHASSGGGRSFLPPLVSPEAGSSGPTPSRLRGRSALMPGHLGRWGWQATGPGR